MDRADALSAGKADAVRRAVLRRQRVGARWDAQYGSMYNDAWVYPSEAERPAGFEKSRRRMPSVNPPDDLK